jgi:hypothetical protein
MLQALGDPPALAVVALGYFVGQVANTLPLRARRAAGMVGVLLPSASRPTSRSRASWPTARWRSGCPAPLGLAALGGLRRRVARWGREVPAPGARVRLGPPTGAAADGLPRPPRALVAVAVLAAAAFAAVTAGIVELPGLEGALEDLTETLGTWTYGLVAAMAFLETGRSSARRPGETAVVLGGVVAAQGEIDLALLLPLAWLSAAAGDLVSFLLAGGSGAGSCSSAARAWASPTPGWRRSRRSSTAMAPRRSSSAASSGSSAPWRRSWRRVGHAAARLRPVEPARHRRLGDDLHLVGYVFHASFATAAELLTRGAPRPRRPGRRGAARAPQACRRPRPRSGREPEPQLA